MLFGFNIADYDTSKSLLAFINKDLKAAIITVSETRRGRAKKVRKVESVVRMCLKLATLESWKDCSDKLTKMLATVEEIKGDVSDVVSGYNW